MSVDKYVREIDEMTKNLVQVSNGVGKLHDDVRDARDQAIADGEQTEVSILEELCIFLASAGIAVEEALNRLTLYGEWIENGALYANVPDEAEVF